MKRLPFALVGVFLCLLCPCLVYADPIPIIHFEVTDLPDLAPGQDLWQYQYFLSYPAADKFLKNQAFGLFFGYSLYQNLESPPPAVDDWYSFVLQPDLIFGAPDDGQYIALALKDDPSLAMHFSLTFVWLGGAGTAPNSQSFLINEFDAEGKFVRSLGSGRTTSSTAIPEPGTLLLVACGLAALSVALRKKK